MQKIIMITGSTDGIGLATAKMLLAEGHHILIHGRTAEKVEATISNLSNTFSTDQMSGFSADLSDLNAVQALANNICQEHKKIDVLINNAGVFKADNPVTTEGYDLRFVVNTIAPYLLTNALKSVLSSGSRVVNLASAAQSPVDIDALLGKVDLPESFSAYAQSKLALVNWTRHLSKTFSAQGILIVSVNPGSLLATKMVQDGFGVAGNDISQGADILYRASLSEEFEGKAGQYFDNDSGKFAQPHPDALNALKNEKIVHAMDSIINHFCKVN